MMSQVDEILSARHLDLKGRCAVPEELIALESIPSAKGFPELRQWMLRYPLVGALIECHRPRFAFDIAVRWLSPPEMRAESNDFYPGIIGVKHGLVPICECMRGSGDPLFLDGSNGSALDPRVVQVFHDSIDDDSIWDESCFRVIAPSVSSFIAAAAFG